MLAKVFCVVIIGGMASNSTTARLVHAAQGGDTHALETLFRRTYPDLVQAARFRLGPELRGRMETLDVAHYAYCEALRSLGDYKYEGKGSFRRWLLGIVENKIRNLFHFHKAQRRDPAREVSLEAAPPPPASTAEPSFKLFEKEDRERLEAAMDRLPEDHREVIVCRYYLGMSWKEIGEQLSRSEEAAQMLRNRALLKLKQLYRSGS